MEFLNEKCKRLINYVMAINKKGRSKQRLAAVDIMKLANYAAQFNGRVEYMFKPEGISQVDAAKQPVELGAVLMTSPGEHLTYVVSCANVGVERYFEQYIEQCTDDAIYNIKQRWLAEGYQPASIADRQAAASV